MNPRRDKLKWERMKSWIPSLVFAASILGQQPNVRLPDETSDPDFPRMVTPTLSRWMMIAGANWIPIFESVWFVILTSRKKYISSWWSSPGIDGVDLGAWSVRSASGQRDIHPLTELTAKESHEMIKNFTRPT